MKKWKKYTAAGVAVLLAGTMAVGYISLAKQDAETAADGNNENRQEIMEALKEVENKSEQEITGDVYKDETVYVTMAPDGSVEKIIVSDWLKNAGKEAELKDVSELTGIQNVKGDETFEQNGTGSCLEDRRGGHLLSGYIRSRASSIDEYHLRAGRQEDISFRTFRQKRGFQDDGEL